MRMGQAKNILIVLVATLLFSFTDLSPGWAQSESIGDFLVAPTLLYYSGIRSRNSQDESSYLFWELKAGYQVSPNIFVGLNYQGDQEKVETKGYSPASLNYATSSNRNSWGPMVGYIFPSFHIVLTYFYSSQWKLGSSTSSGSNHYDYEGWGYQLDLGYKIPVWGGFFGPQISYKSFTYSKLKTNGGSSEGISPALKENKFDPSIVFYYFF